MYLGLSGSEIITGWIGTNDKVFGEFYVIGHQSH